MPNEECYIQDPKTGLFKGSRPSCEKKTAKVAFNRKLKAGVAKKKDVKPRVFHGTEFATPDKVDGDINEYHDQKFKETAKILKEHGSRVPDESVAKHYGNGFFTGDASGYEPTGKPTASGADYEKVPHSVAINRIFSYKTKPKLRDKYVVVGDMEKEDGKIERREVKDTGMFNEYTDEKGVIQKYPHQSNIVDFHPKSLEKFCGKQGCDKRKIMMKTCQTPAECEQVKKEMKEKIKKWREENVKK